MEYWNYKFFGHKIFVILSFLKKAVWLKKEHSK